MPKRKRTDVPALIALGRSSYVSKRGISHLADAFRSEGVPEATSRATQYRARKTVCNVQTPYGTLVQSVPLACPDGNTIDCAVQHPLAMLYHASAESNRFATVMRTALDNMPCASASPGRSSFTRMEWTRVMDFPSTIPGSPMFSTGASLNLACEHCRTSAIGFQLRSADTTH